MTDDAELRARIEAQVAARRAGANPSKGDRSAGRKAVNKPDEKPADEPESAAGGDVNGAPGSLSPTRPWARTPTPPPPPPPPRPRSATGLTPALPWQPEAGDAPPAAVPAPSNPEVVLRDLAAELGAPEPPAAGRRSRSHPVAETTPRRRRLGRRAEEPGPVAGTDAEPAGPASGSALAAPAAYVPDEATVTAYVEAAAPVLDEPAPSADEEPGKRRRRRRAADGEGGSEASPDRAEAEPPKVTLPPAVPPSFPDVAAPSALPVAEPEPGDSTAPRYPWQRQEEVDLDLRGAPTWDPAEYADVPDEQDGSRGRRAMRWLLARAPEADEAPAPVADAVAEPVVPPVAEPVPLAAGSEPAEDETPTGTPKRPLLGRLRGRHDEEDDEPYEPFTLPAPDKSFEEPWLRPSVPSPTRSWRDPDTPAPEPAVGAAAPEAAAAPELEAPPAPAEAPAPAPRVRPTPADAAPPAPTAATPPPAPAPAPPVVERPRPGARPSPAPRHAAQPGARRAARPPAEPVAAPVAEAVVEPAAAPVAEPVAEPVAATPPRLAIGISGATAPDRPAAHRAPSTGISGASSWGTTSGPGPDLAKFLEATEPQPGDDEDEQSAKRVPQRARRMLVRTFIVLLIAAIAAVLLRAFVVQPYYIPSASMEPTLHGCTGCNDDHVLVDKLSYRAHDVRSGDIVVFHRPPNATGIPDKVLIKRVVALPGDDVELKKGHVYVNGLVLDEPYVNKACGANATVPLNGTAKWKVPGNDVFVMGDNRCHSDDSRIFGPIAKSSIIGRAFAIIWPIGRIRLL